MERRLKDPVERFLVRFDRGEPDECWEWTGARTNDRYGMFWPYGRAKGKHYAHRFSYEHFVGPIPDGHQVDHLCGNPACVNPSHLEPVSESTNHRRARGWTERDGQWFCSQGHLMDDYDYVPGRGCRVCFNLYKQAWRERNPHDRERDNERRRQKRAEVT